LESKHYAVEEVKEKVSVVVVLVYPIVVDLFCLNCTGTSDLNILLLFKCR